MANATQSLPIPHQQPIRSSRRVSIGNDKALSSSATRPTFEPYPSQSMPVSMNSPTMKRKTRRPSETAPVLCQHCGKVGSQSVHTVSCSSLSRITSISSVSSSICKIVAAACAPVPKPWAAERFSRDGC